MFEHSHLSSLTVFILASCAPSFQVELSVRAVFEPCVILALFSFQSKQLSHVRDMENLRAKAREEALEAAKQLGEVERHKQCQNHNFCQVSSRDKMKNKLHRTNKRNTTFELSHLHVGFCPQTQNSEPTLTA